MTLSGLFRTFALCSTLVLAASASASDAAPDMPKAGDMAPLIVGKTASGDVVDISQYRGKVVVLSFWATWCAYCMKELPILENIQKSSGGSQIKVLAINTESAEVFRQVNRGLKGLTLGLLYDPKKVAQDAYRVGGIPHMVIIDRNGRIVQVHRGYGESSIDEFVSDINNALLTPYDAPATAAAEAKAGGRP